VNLANLIQTKNSQAIADNTKGLQKSLGQLAEGSKSLPGPRVAVLSNAKFSSAVQLAAQSIGTVAQLLEERKARRELEDAIRKGDAPISALFDAVQNDVTAAYERQKSTLGATGVMIIGTYKREQEAHSQPNAVLMLLLADRLNDYRAHEVTLQSANPQPAIEGMRKAHSALVAYVTSNKSPKTFADLAEAAEDFFNRAQPLGEAVMALLNAR
jgi:hypothetical protein